MGSLQENVTSGRIDSLALQANLSKYTRWQISWNFPPVQRVYPGKPRMFTSFHASILASMQLPKLIKPSPLPSPPLLQSLFLETPGAWVVVLLCVIIAAVLITRPRRELKITGIFALLVATTVGCLQHFIVTQREDIIARSRAATIAVAKADIPALGQLLAPEFQAKYPQYPQGLTRDRVITRATELFAANPAEVSFGEICAVVDNQRFARAQVLVTGQHSLASGFPVTMWWTLSFEKTSNGWQLTGAEMTSSNIPNF